MQTQQNKALTGSRCAPRVMVKNRKILGRRSFLGGLRNLGPTHLTYKLSISWEGTDPGTQAHRGAAVPPRAIFKGV